MQEQKYSVNQHLLETILVWVKSGEIAIPEIQRPFVWDAVQVRDLMDSLYQGYPVGYLIAWRNPTVRLKDGTRSEGKRILIDGQQRVTALMAAVRQHLGDRVEVAGANAGLHLLLWLRGVPAVRTPRIVARAARAGVGVYAPDHFYLGRPPGAGLVLGYASLDEDAIREGVRRLARSL